MRTRPLKRTTKASSTHVLLAAIVLGACAMRLWRIDAQSLWFDEGWSVHLAREPLMSALAQMASPGHTHPPAYYLLLMVWVRLLGHSVIAVRGLSAVLGVATVLALYGLTRAVWNSPRAGILAAALLSVAPAHIVYSQETRMYALLMLLSTLELHLVWDLLHNASSLTLRWAALALCQALALNTHYFAVALLFPLNIYVVATVASSWAKPERRVLFGRWIAVQALSLAAMVPWLTVALGRTIEHQALGADAVTFAAFIRGTASFLLGGHTALAGRITAFAALASSVLAVAVLVGIIVAIDDSRRSAAIYGLWHVLGPLATILAIMTVRPGYHPRYALVVLPTLACVVAGSAEDLAHGPFAHRACCVLILGLWTAAVVVAGRALITDPYYQRDNARSTVRYLDRALPSRSPVLVTTDDWALAYYLEGTALNGLLLEVDRQPAEEIIAHVDEALANHQRAATVRWHQGDSDYAGLLPFLLERRGSRVETKDLSGYSVDVYELHTGPAPSLVDCPGVSFRSIDLVSGSIETGVPVDEAIALSLLFEPHDVVEPELKVSLRLLDPDGHVMARTDALLRDRQGRDSGHWSPKSRVTTRHLLPLAVGLAPITYTVDMGIYSVVSPEGLDLLDIAGAPAGKRFALAQLALSPPTHSRASDLVDRERFGLVADELPMELGTGVELNARRIWRQEVASGERVEVLLEWGRKGLSGTADVMTKLELRRQGQAIASGDGGPAGGLFPTSRWQPDQKVLEWRSIQVPVEDPGGTAELWLSAETGAEIMLGSIEVRAVARSFVAPEPKHPMSTTFDNVIAFVGYDGPGDILAANEPVPLVLYWQALDTPGSDYVVFTHILDDAGRLVAQHDGVPLSGARPTSGWLAGEYFRDEHMLTWLVPEYRGPFVLEIGWYEPATGMRLHTASGDTEVVLSATGTVQ